MGARALAIVVIVLTGLTWRGSGRADVSYQTGTIQGTLLLSNGQPFPGGSVSATPVGGSGGLSTGPDATGSFTLSLVPVGTYQVTASYQMFQIGTQSVTVTAGQTSTLAFTFLAGTVQVSSEQDGAAVAGASMRLEELAPTMTCGTSPCPPPDANGNCYCPAPSGGGKGMVYCTASGCVYMDPGSQFFASTDATGFAAALVPAASYLVTVSSAPAPGDYGSVTLGNPNTVTVADQQTVFAGDYPYDTGIVSGSVTEGGSPVTNANIQATPASGSGNIGTNVDTSGNYSLRLPLGTYELSAYIGMGPPFAVQSVTVVPGSQSVPFTYSQPGGYLTGSVVADGTPAQGATVQIDTVAVGLTCASAGCSPPDPNGNCFCPAPGGPKPGGMVFCTPSGCVYQGPGYDFFATTDANGSFSVFLAPDTYAITVSSAPTPGDYGGVVVGSYSATITSTSGASVGTTSYETGVVTGQVTSCGQPLSNVSVTAQSSGAFSGAVSTGADQNGNYTLRVPVGTYGVSADWQMEPIPGGGSVQVNAGQTSPTSFDFPLGQVRGLVLGNGAPSVNSNVQIQQLVVGYSCATAGCTPPDANGNCFCPAPGGPKPGGMVFCTPSGCVYQGPGYDFFANTGADGFFTATVPPGSYLVTAYSSQASGQSGGVAVGSVEVTALACQLVEVGTSGGTVSGGTNVVVPLGDGVQLTFQSVSSGTVGYTATSTPQGAPPPENIELAGLFYDITTTATFSGPVQICLPYDVDVTDPAQLKLLHNVSDGQGGYTWVDITTSVDTVNHLVCGSTPSFSWFSVGILKVVPPVANAGAPFTVAADGTCHASVTLNGSGSRAGSTAIASYQWFNQGTPIGTGETLTTTLGLGVTVITLKVTDVDGGTSSASVQVTVADQTPPSIRVSESPSTIWPPNGRMVALTPTLSVSDNCDPSPSVVLASATCPTASPGDIVVSSAQQVSVRAFRNGNETGGRVYTVTYRATDKSGNTSTASATATVPHDQGKN